jgi:hypothetical protein
MEVKYSLLIQFEDTDKNIYVRLLINYKIYSIRELKFPFLKEKKYSRFNLQLYR